MDSSRNENRENLEVTQLIITNMSKRQTGTDLEMSSSAIFPLKDEGTSLRSQS